MSDSSKPTPVTALPAEEPKNPAAAPIQQTEQGTILFTFMQSSFAALQECWAEQARLLGVDEREQELIFHMHNATAICVGALVSGIPKEALLRMVAGQYDEVEKDIEAMAKDLFGLWASRVLVGV